MMTTNEINVKGKSHEATVMSLESCQARINRYEALDEAALADLWRACFRLLKIEVPKDPQSMSPDGVKPTL